MSSIFALVKLKSTSNEPSITLQEVHRVIIKIEVLVAWK